MDVSEELVVKVNGLQASTFLDPKRNSIKAFSVGAVSAGTTPELRLMTAFSFFLHYLVMATTVSVELQKDTGYGK